MTNAKSPTDTSLPNALFPTGTPEPLNKPCALPLPSLNRTLSQTRFLLATPWGWIMDQSKRPLKSNACYTQRFELALSYVSHEAAVQRAKALRDVEPGITVMPLQLICQVSNYPFGWQAEHD